MINVDYFTDVLCVWAFIGEQRLNEVENQLGKHLDIQLQFLPNFASVIPKIEAGWKDKGGFEGYAQHVHDVANQFEITLHPDVWLKTRPSTSMMAHALIKSVENVHDHDLARHYASALRTAFFIEALDISDISVCEAVAKQLQVDWVKVLDSFNHGHGLSSLNSDFQNAKEYQVAVSPAWVFNEGRQKLVGNVGYRVIEANLKELIVEKPLKHNWC